MGAGTKGQARIQPDDMFGVGWCIPITRDNPEARAKLHGLKLVQPDTLPLLIFKFPEINLLWPVNSRHQA